MNRRALEVTLDDATVERLEAEAAERGIALEQLVLELLCRPRGSSPNPAPAHS